MPFDFRKQYISNPKLWDLKNSVIVKRRVRSRRGGKASWKYVTIYNVKNDVYGEALKKEGVQQDGRGKYYSKAVMKPVRPELESENKEKAAELAVYDYSIRQLNQRLTPAEKFAERARSQYEHVIKEGGIHMPLKVSKKTKPLKKAIKQYIGGPPGRRIAQI